MKACLEKSILRTICFISVYSYSLNLNAQLVPLTHSDNQGQSANNSLKHLYEVSETSSEHNELPASTAKTPSLPIMNTFENITYWAESEEEILKLMKARHAKVKEVIRKMNKRLKKYNVKSETKKEQMSDTIYTGIYQDYQKHKTEDFREDVGFKTINLPSFIDLELAMNALIQIQRVYSYDQKNLPAVLSPETEKPPSLHALHCSQIGMHALSQEYYAEAIEWIEHAIHKVTQDQDYSTKLSLLEYNRELAIEMHNEMLSDVKASTSKIDANLFDHFVLPNEKHSRRRKRRPTSEINGKGSLEEAQQYAEFNFNAICNGEDYRTAQERSKLRCWYDTRSSPARTILPYKKELISSEPEVTRVYDIIGDKLISSLVESKQNCSKVANKLSSANSSAEMHLSFVSSCWLQIPELKFVVRKAASLTHTDLRPDGSFGPCHLNAYIIGRVNHVHLDTMPAVPHKSKDPFYDSLKSLLFYFNDVPAGGSTAFPTAGIAALPVKGSVVYWQNMYRNGSRRIDTWHGACPVIYGMKRVLVMGIHSYEQFRTYPCTLNPYE